MKNVFVYGSLKKKFFNHSLIEDNRRNRFIRKGTVEGYKLYILWSYPAIKTATPTDLISVELYSLTDEVFEKIDRMEQNAGYHPVEVVDDKGKEGVVYVYEGAVKEENLIPHGVWMKGHERLNIVGAVDEA